MVVYNGTAYAYVKNLQGDIVAILDSTGTAVVQYKYDAWGRQISCDVAAGNSNATALSTLNPFRYRGYVYDEETELYYLNTRYFHPVCGRYLNPDRFTSTNQGVISCNMFLYCSNNPIIFGDSSGEFFFSLLGACIGAVASGIDALVKGMDDDEVIEQMKEGAKIGAVAGAGFDVAIVVVDLTAGHPTGCLLGAAAIATSCTMAYGMATDTPVVVDVSRTASSIIGLSGKIGGSLVIDFSSEDVPVYAYGHLGIGLSAGGSPFGWGYSVGVVHNWNDPAQFSGKSEDRYIGSYIGVELGKAPGPIDDVVHSWTLTFSPGFSMGMGYDWYTRPIQIK